MRGVVSGSCGRLGRLWAPGKFRNTETEELSSEWQCMCLESGCALCPCHAHRA